MAPPSVLVSVFHLSSSDEKGNYFQAQFLAETWEIIVCQTNRLGKGGIITPFLNFYINVINCNEYFFEV